MSSSTPTPFRSCRPRGAALIAALAALLIALPLVGARSGWAGQPTTPAQPTIAAVAAGAVDGRGRLVLDLPSADRFALSPESFSVSVAGQPLPTTAGPVMSDRLTMAVVIDASEAAAPVLQRGLSGAADFALATPPAVGCVLVADTSPPSVVTPLQPGPAAMLQGLSRIESHGARQTAEAVELALHQLPVETDDPRLIVLYTAAPDAAGYPAADLVARLTSAGVVLAVVAAAGDDAAAPPYWSSVAAATGGVAVGVRDAEVVDAFARVRTALRTRYLLTFPAPNRLPADAVVRIDTPTGPLTAGAVIPAPTPAPAVQRCGHPCRPAGRPGTRPGGAGAGGRRGRGRPRPEQTARDSPDRTPQADEPSHRVRPGELHGEPKIRHLSHAGSPGTAGAAPRRAPRADRTDERRRQPNRSGTSLPAATAWWNGNQVTRPSGQPCAPAGRWYCRRPTTRRVWE